MSKNNKPITVGYQLVNERGAPCRLYSHGVFVRDADGDATLFPSRQAAQQVVRMFKLRTVHVKRVTMPAWLVELWEWGTPKAIRQRVDERVRKKRQRGKTTARS